MINKISKLKNVVSKYGFVGMIKKVIQYLCSQYGGKLKYISYIFQRKKYENIINEILNDDYDRIVIWKSDFGWNVPLFQRPQHIAKNLSENRCLVFYEVTTMTDDVRDIKKIYKNLYLINFNNPTINKILFKLIEYTKKNKYIQVYSTDYKMSLKQMKSYIENGYKILYEYIDDLSPKILGTNELPKNLKDKYEYMLSDKENVYVVVTADAIEKDVILKRGKEKLAFACNGVDYNHFKNLNKEIKFDEEFEKILKQNKPIIGYYGALASWFDYELLKYLAENRKEYNIVLFGVKYDNSMERENLDKYSNIYYLGARKYEILQNYANKFTVCTIPFLINSITNATSPVKLFEYMALEKPIVTTAMTECKKYKSVMIANNKKEFIELIDKAINFNKQNNKEYYDVLKKETLENTWNEKAKIIVDMLKKYEY